MACQNKKLELLVYGKFTLNDEDINGQMAYHWLSKSNLLEMGFDEPDIDLAVEEQEHLADLQEVYSRCGVPPGECLLLVILF